MTKWFKYYSVGNKPIACKVVDGKCVKIKLTVGDVRRRLGPPIAIVYQKPPVATLSPFRGAH